MIRILLVVLLHFYDYVKVRIVKYNLRSVGVRNVMEDAVVEFRNSALR